MSHIPLIFHFRAVGQLKKWSELPHILKQDRRKIWKIKGKGYQLIESVIKCLEKDYDIRYKPKEVLDKISSELISKLEYTTFMKSPISQKDVDYNMIEKSPKGKAACDVYLPALSNALDLHIRVIQKIGDFFAVLNTYPTEAKETKTVNLAYDEKYMPVVYINIDKNVGVVSPQQPTPTTSTSTTTTSTPSSSQGVEIVGYQEPDVIVISDTDEEEGGDTEVPIEVIPSSNPEVDGPQSPLLPPDSSIEPINIVPLDGANDDPLPTISPPFDQRKKIPFDMRPYRGMIPEVVNKIPWEINGIKYYMVEIPEGEFFCDRYKDGRYFVMNTSRRKGFRGVRRTGKCRGNFICRNDQCAFYKEEKKYNQTHFRTLGEDKFCFTCNTLAVRNECGAAKMIEYELETRILRVYHYGDHKCSVRINNREHDDYMKKSLNELGGKVTPKQLAQIQMTKELAKQMEEGVTDMSAIVDIAAKLTNKQRISEIKKTLQTQLKSEKHSLSAVAELKSITDTSDKYLIYKIYDSNMTGSGNSYVFKSSRKMGQLAINMDQNQLIPCPLMEEPAYFDGMHKRCEGWKTLTLWLYHPASCRLYRIATMEVKAEDTANCAEFWNVFNEMLREIKNDERLLSLTRRFYNG